MRQRAGRPEWLLRARVEVHTDTQAQEGGVWDLPRAHRNASGAVTAARCLPATPPFDVSIRMSIGEAQRWSTSLIETLSARTPLPDLLMPRRRRLSPPSHRHFYKLRLLAARPPSQSLPLPSVHSLTRLRAAVQSGGRECGA